MTDSRDTAQDSIRRRRACLGCGRKFTTYEFEEKFELEVIKSNGQRRPFDASKIRAGIVKACQKRDITLDKIDSVMGEIERQIYNIIEPEISTNKIGEIVLVTLKNLDDVAYIRFASVYHKFDCIQTFLDFIKSYSSKS